MEGHIRVGDSVQFSRSVVSNSLQPHELQHTRPPCPSPTPGVHSDSRPSSPWCHPAISSSVVPFSSCPQSLPASVFSNESTLRMRWPHPPNTILFPCSNNKASQKIIYVCSHHFFTYFLLNSFQFIFRLHHYTIMVFSQSLSTW